MENTFIEMENGQYTIQLQALKTDEEEASAMANYLSQVAVVTKHDDYVTLTLLFQSEKTITGFQVEQNDGTWVEAIEKHVDEEMERRAEAFQLEHLPRTLLVRVQYEVEHEGKSFSGDEKLRLVFDQESLQEAK